MLGKFLEENYVEVHYIVFGAFDGIDSAAEEIVEDEVLFLLTYHFHYYFGNELGDAYFFDAAVDRGGAFH